MKMSPAANARRSELRTKKSRLDLNRLFFCRIPVHNRSMIYGYARVSTDGQSVKAQVKQMRDAGAEKVFRETASGRRDVKGEPVRKIARIVPAATARFHVYAKMQMQRQRACKLLLTS